MQDQSEPVDELIAAITAKLHAKRSVLAQSIGFGRLTWRSKKGKIDVKLEPEV